MSYVGLFLPRLPEGGIVMVLTGWGGMGGGWWRVVVKAMARRFLIFFGLVQGAVEGLHVLQ